jgi:hypothetical protein
LGYNLGEQMFKFLTKANYLHQQLTDPQFTLITYIDNVCKETLDGPIDGDQLHVHHFIVPISKLFLPMDTICKSVLKDLPKEGRYLPRSVAFLQSGLDWHFMIGVYSNAPVDQTKQIMFMDLCTRTNTARNEKEQ